MKNRKLFYSRYPRLKPWHENSTYELRSTPFGRNSIHPRASPWNSALRVISRRADLRRVVVFDEKKVARKFTALRGNPQRFKWTFDAVIDTTGPELLLRNYLEHRDLGEYLRFVRENREIKKAVDVGCGFGRLEMLLSEYSGEVVGFEREPGLVRLRVCSCLGYSPKFASFKSRTWHVFPVGMLNLTLA